MGTVDDNPTDPPTYGEFPLRDFLGLQVADVGGGRATARIDISDAHLNPNGVVHGAVLFALADTAMGGAAMSVLDEGQFATSVDLQLRFVRPASQGGLLTRVEVLKRGRNVIHLEGRIEGDGGRLIATASGTFTTLSF